MADNQGHGTTLTGGRFVPEENSLFVVGNATVIIRMAGFTILTDPNFIHQHEQVPLGYGLRATRLTDPAIEFAHLPPIDFVLLSHFHGDHFDQVAEQELARDIPIVTPPGAAEELQERGFQDVRPLERWHSVGFEKGKSRVIITSTPAKHGPSLVSFALPETMGSVLEFQSPQPAPRLYISGDTLMIDDIQQIRNRFREIDYGVLHLGGTEVMGVTVTADAEHGVRLLHALQPDRVIPIHYDDYDVFKSPVEDFLEAAGRAGWEGRIDFVKRGESIALRKAGAAVR